jgi:hypothetical protein
MTSKAMGCHSKGRVCGLSRKPSRMQNATIKKIKQSKTTISI